MALVKKHEHLYVLSSSRFARWYITYTVIGFFILCAMHFYFYEAWYSGFILFLLFVAMLGEFIARHDKTEIDLMRRIVHAQVSEQGRTEVKEIGFEDIDRIEVKTSQRGFRSRPRDRAWLYLRLRNDEQVRLAALLSFQAFEMARELETLLEIEPKIYSKLDPMKGYDSV